MSPEESSHVNFASLAAVSFFPSLPIPLTHVFVKPKTYSSASRAATIVLFEFIFDTQVFVKAKTYSFATLTATIVLFDFIFDKYFSKAKKWWQLGILFWFDEYLSVKR
eukprot:GHVL01000704.1.p1 GENE.GHVL01000704.1~~GHVL01000704.1.p1  ORF type:complete len:108 (+),score=6.07 GHVL01000704.1:760-1083(+)